MPDRDKIMDDLRKVERGELPSGSVIAKVTGSDSLHSTSAAKPKYIVRVSRTETIEFEVEADSVEQARETYLSDGEETVSNTSDLTILDVWEDQS